MEYDFEGQGDCVPYLLTLFLPVTVTANSAHVPPVVFLIFYSEGDYWWPDPNNPNGPYIQKDGLTNPDDFVAHCKAMIRFSKLVGLLTSAYIITKEASYAVHAIDHLKAWFIDTATL
jgi:hypothetical protein